MNITKITQYKKQGKIVFLYAVTGTDEELQFYKQIKGDNYKEDEGTGKPLYWSTNFYMPGTKLSLNFNKTAVYPDTSEFDEAASMASQYGGNLGQSLADIAAAKLMRISNKPQTRVVEDPQETNNSSGPIDQQ